MPLGPRARVHITKMQRAPQRYHPHGHTCECNAVYVLCTSNSAANPGREFYACPNKKQNDPNSGCSHKFCWVDEYPQGFVKKSFGRGRGGGGYAPQPQPQPPRAQYAGFSNSPQPQHVPPPQQFKRAREDEAEQPATRHPSPVNIEVLNELAANVESLRSELRADVAEVRDLLVTVANDIVNAIKAASSPDRMESESGV